MSSDFGWWTWPAISNEHRCQREKELHLSEPSLQLHAYCSTQLSIGAEITVTVTAGEYKAKDAVLVQKNTPVDLLLGTNLMSKLRIKILDAKGQSLLNDQKNLTSPATEERFDLNSSPQLLNDQKNLTSPATEERLDLNSSPQQPLVTEPPLREMFQTVLFPNQPFPCRTISGSHQKVPAPIPRQKAIVHLVRGSKLPALSGKWLQAKVCQGQLSPPHQLFELNSRLHSNSLLLSCKKGQLFLPVYNFAEAPTWLRRGQILGWTQNTEVVDMDLHPLNNTLEPAFQSPDQPSPENTRVKVDIGSEIPLTNHRSKKRTSWEWPQSKPLWLQRTVIRNPPEPRNPLPRIDDTSDVLSGACYFTTLNFASRKWPWILMTGKKQLLSLIKGYLNSL